jgi:uncharacterized membrane protein YdfJ with MMPL/SSD domain
MWGNRVYRDRRGILVATVVVLVAAVAMLCVGGHLTIGVFDNAESKRAEELIETLQRPGESAFVAMLDSASREQIAAITARLKAHPEVVSVIGPAGAPSAVAEHFYSQDMRYALLAVTLKGDLPTASKHYPEVRALITEKAAFTGKLVLQNDLEAGLARDLLHAELIAAPISILLLFFVFRSIIAALLPVVVGGLAVATGVAGVLALSYVTQVPSYAINICSLIGLGVAIDYSLFIVSRYRSEIAEGKGIEDALAVALHTAGRSVVYSGLTVAVGLAGLLFFHGSFLAAMGFAGALVVAFAVIAALTTLPALLAVLGPRLELGHVPLHLRDRGRVHAFATWVTRHPVLVLVPCILFVGLAAWPYSRLEVASTDVRVLPPDAEARIGYELLQQAFPDVAATRVNVVVDFPGGLTVERVRALYDATRKLAKLPHVKRIESIVDLDDRLTLDLYENFITLPALARPPELQFAFDTMVTRHATLITVIADTRPNSAEARDLVKALRSERHIGDGYVLVGGQTARDFDSLTLIRERTPYAIAFIMATSVLVLFALLRSVLLPLKAVLMNLLSIGASFGALVYIFQEGHGRALLGFEPGPIEPTLPVMLFCIVFGLSMDYEVLLLHRMQEAYEAGNDNACDVAMGLAKTSGLITSAAAIMVSVFAAFAMARILVIKATGVGISVAVIMDATIVRLLIVPASMQLLGRANWWAPGWAKRRV